MIEFDKLDEFFKRKIILEGKYRGTYYDLHLHTKASDGFLDVKLRAFDKTIDTLERDYESIYAQGSK